MSVCQTIAASDNLVPILQWAVAVHGEEGCRPLPEPEIFISSTRPLYAIPVSLSLYFLLGDNYSKLVRNRLRPGRPSELSVAREAAARVPSPPIVSVAHSLLPDCSSSWAGIVRSAQRRLSRARKVLGTELRGLSPGVYS